ncbi:MAG: hypothetical protein JWQ33_2950 [Ramlibacter sp.]|nr:hypothetical protein [Ramlibacter sp.]
MTLPLLSAVEARVLGTLMEKARTVPDSYPLTLNSLVLGCNQKSSREPLMNITEPQAQEALDNLKQLSTGSGQSLAREASGSRVARWEHNFQRAIGVPEQSAVLLGLLLLRGPQTAGELRINSERWYRFADISSVEAFLDELEQRSQDKGGPLVVKLPRAVGMREQRWAHLLCGPVDMATAAAGAPTEAVPPAPAGAGLSLRVESLEREVAQLRSALENLCDQLGVSPLRHPEKNDRADN